MDVDVVLEVGRDSLYLTVLLAAPMLLAALAVGLLVGIIQAATQVQEQTLSFIPKLLALVVTLAVGGHWMVNNWLYFSRELYVQIPALVG